MYIYIMPKLVSLQEILEKFKKTHKNQYNYSKVKYIKRIDKVNFASLRAGSIPGTHIVGFDSSTDTIELKHTARNREGFALGAVMAAEWIQGKKGFFEINDMMNEMIGDKNV